MKEVSKFLRKILGHQFPSARGNAARASQWQESGGYVRLPSGCPECGGWYLHRNDDRAGITAHFIGCSRTDLSLFEKAMGWFEIIEYYDRLKIGKIV